MTDKREKTKTEIKLYSDIIFINLLLWSLDQCKTSSDQKALMICDWVDGCRHWRPTPLLLKLKNGYPYES
jgi:hypothetical protein